MKDHTMPTQKTVLKNTDFVQMPIADTKKVHLMSLGCSKNQVDSEVMLGNFRDRSYQYTAEIKEADIIVVNTCGFVEDSKTESINAILEAAQYKDKTQGSCEVLAVVGCLSQRYKDKLKDLIPEIDFLSGTSDFHRISELIEHKEEASEVFGLPETKGKPQFEREHEVERQLSGTSYSNYVKISEGCVKMCSFCIIPHLRGPLRSRTIEDIVEEIKLLVKKGVVEINLVAQDLTDYGRDMSFKKRLIDVLQAVEQIEGLRWARLLYCYPENFTDDLIDFLATSKKVLPYLDIPLQHCNDRILKVMNRRVNQAQIRELFAKLKTRVPKLTIRTTFIVGFPSETQAEFDDLCQFVADMKFDHVGVFTYSHEEGTKAGQMEDDVPTKVKKSRRNQLMKVQSQVSRKNLQKYVKNTIEVLVEGPHPETDLLLIGRASFQAPEIDGNVIINDGSATIGSVVKVKIEKAHHYDLIGGIVEAQ